MGEVVQQDSPLWQPPPANCPAFFFVKTRKVEVRTANSAASKSGSPSQQRVATAERKTPVVRSNSNRENSDSDDEDQKAAIPDDSCATSDDDQQAAIPEDSSDSDQEAAIPDNCNEKNALR